VSFAARAGCWLWLLVFLQQSGMAHAQPDTTDKAVCGRAALDAEQQFGLPFGILLAIGKAESNVWPWTANVDGAAEIYHSKAEAVEALTRVRSPHPTNMDIGCFQISTRYHPAAFASVAEALDPVANATYAARFLRALREKTGDWIQAIGAYHSATEPLGAVYRQQVMALWNDAPNAMRGEEVRPVAVVAVATPRWRVIPIGASVQPEVRVWSLATLETAAGMKLPRVITSGR
jgi:hypothetical protein